MLKEETIGIVKIFHLGDKIMGGSETQEIRVRLKELVEEGILYLVMDFADVRWINSAGVGVIISCLTTLRNSEGDIRVANLHDATEHYFNITQLESIVNVYDSVSKAVESFADIDGTN